MLLALVPVPGCCGDNHSVCWSCLDFGLACKQFSLTGVKFAWFVCALLLEQQASVPLLVALHMPGTMSCRRREPGSLWQQQQRPPDCPVATDKAIGGEKDTLSTVRPAATSRAVSDQAAEEFAMFLRSLERVTSEDEMPGSMLARTYRVQNAYLRLPQQVACLKVKGMCN